MFPEHFPHLVSGVIIFSAIDKIGMFNKEWFSHSIICTLEYIKLPAHVH
jgi:hypothetical protein